MKSIKLNFYHISFIIFLSLALLPRTGVIDNSSFQWLFLSIFNIVLLLYSFTSLGLKDFIKIFKINSLSLKSYLIFLLIAFISIFYAFNIPEALITFSTLLNGFILFFILRLIINNTSKNFVLIGSSVLLFLHLFFIFIAYFNISNQISFNFNFSNLLPGLTGNKNIAAAIIVFHLPLAVYLFYHFKNFILKLSFFVLSTISFYVLLLLSSRAAFVSLFAILLIYIIDAFYKKRKSQLFVFIFSFLISFFFLKFSNLNGASLSPISRLNTISTQDKSTSQRLDYYADAFYYMIDNPLYGVGLGNWKIKSIDLQSSNIINYKIPYHVHNDFLQFGAELGFVGFLSYLLFFVIILYQLIRSYIKSNDSSLPLFLLLSFIAFFIDSNLNFPHARPLQVASFALFYALFLTLRINKSHEEDF